MTRLPHSNSLSPPASEDDHSTSSSAALFYLTSTNYSEVESAYLTSEEVGFQDDEDDDNYDSDYYRGGEDDVSGGITTPKCSNSRHGSSGTDTRSNRRIERDSDVLGKYFRKGDCPMDQHQVVYLDPLMSSLLGVEVLPPLRNRNQGPDCKKLSSNRQLLVQKRQRGMASFDVLEGSSRDAFSFDDEDDDDDDDDDEEEDEEDNHDDDNGDDDTMKNRPIDLGASLSQSMIPKYARRRGPIRRLRRQLGNNNKHDKQKRNQHKRRARGKAKHHGLINNTSIEIDRHILQVEMARKRLQSVKSDIKFTQSRAKKLMLGAQQSANRVSKLSKNIFDLECKLDLSLRALEQERDAINKNLAKLAHLNAMERALEDEANEIECNLRDCLEHGERAGVAVKSSASMNGNQLEDGTSDDIGGDIASRRRRADTDASFVTAKQPSPTTSAFGKRSASHNDLRQQHNQFMSHRKSSNAQVSPIEKKTSSARKVLTQMPSFLRIHDLEMDEIHLKSKSNDRPDLFPIHSNNDSHHALNALMKLALKYATDESSRWTPDRGTESILSKRPTCDQKWHYATESDIFVWYGKLDAGYKSELPAIKARAMVKTSARNLLELLIDSSKVKQYNKMSLGREDKAFIKEGLETNNGKIEGEAKIVRSVSNVPMIRKKLELVSLLYAKALDEKMDGMKGYIIVNRSVWEDENRAPTADGNGDTVSDCNYIRSEILLGVNLIRDIGQDSKCEITTINHFYTPGTPTFGARQFGMKAASNFLRDLQNQFE